MNILEITEYDLFGRTFNGYDIMCEMNAENRANVSMKVLRKFSPSKQVVPLFQFKKEVKISDKLREAEREIFNMMSVLSITSPALYESEEYKMADVAHYHQFHNSNLGFFELEKEALLKPTIISFHDPWMMTGRCVHMRECEGFKTGCHNCQRLDTLFDFKEDMSHKMWNIKKSFFESADVDIIVHSDYMYRLAKENPYTKNAAIHLIPFGVDVNDFCLNKTKAESRKEFGIPENNSVLFFRQQADFKGTNYIVEALSRLENTENITLLTCSEKGLLKSIADRFQIIELGGVSMDTIKECYNACDVFLMPSIGESFGMMAVEAMASGKPVVVFDNTALPSVTNAPEIGVLVRDLDSFDLYKKIKHLIDNPEECKKRGEMGREFVSQKYSPAEYKNKMEETYISAYNRQKYKLDALRKELSFDKSDAEVGKLLYHLDKVFKTIFKHKSIDILKDAQLTPCTVDQIDFENENVKAAVMTFNLECRNILKKQWPILLVKRKLFSLLWRIYVLIWNIFVKPFKKQKF